MNVIITTAFFVASIWNFIAIRRCRLGLFTVSGAAVPASRSFNLDQPLVHSQAGLRLGFSIELCG